MGLGEHHHRLRRRCRRRLRVWDWLYSDQFRSIGIAVSLLAIVLAALSLTLDFGAIEGGVAAGAPKHMEWYLAFSLTVTLVWLHITLLRLLALLNRA